MTTTLITPRGTFYTRAENVPYGKCHCGCGGTTNRAEKTYISKGIKKGDPFKFLVGHGGRRGREPVPLAERFWEQVDIKGEADCWLWVGVKRAGGYGHVTQGKANYLTHRVAYALVNGDIPKGLVVRHDCDIKACCNPSHLTIGTTRDNSADAVERGQQPRGERVGGAKLTDVDVLEIRRRHPGGATISQLSRDYKVSRTTIRSAIRRTTWTHLP